MKLEQSTKIDGALRTPIYTEVIETLKKSQDTDTLYLNNQQTAQSDTNINLEIMVSQLVRLVSLLSKTADLSTLPQDQQDSFQSIIEVFEKYPTMGDQMLSEDGKGRVESAMITSAQQAANFADVTGSVVITDPYEGFENVSKTSSCTKVERQLLVDEILQQAVVEYSALTVGDQVVVDSFIESGLKADLTGTYIDVPTGRNIYDVLELIYNQDLSIVMSAHINGGTIFDTDLNEFATKYTA